jgi:hypothetical protein
MVSYIMCIAPSDLEVFFVYLSFFFCYSLSRHPATTNSTGLFDDERLTSITSDAPPVHTLAVLCVDPATFVGDGQTRTTIVNNYGFTTDTTIDMRFCPRLIEMQSALVHLLQIALPVEKTPSQHAIYPAITPSTMILRYLLARPVAQTLDLLETVLMNSPLAIWRHVHISIAASNARVLLRRALMSWYMLETGDRDGSRQVDREYTLDYDDEADGAARGATAEAEDAEAFVQRYVLARGDDEGRCERVAAFDTNAADAPCVEELDDHEY